MKKQVRKSVQNIGINLFLFSMSTLSIFSQSFDTIIPSADGRILIISEKTAFIADEMSSDAMYIDMTPENPNELAHAIIKDGTLETHIYAKKIHYEPNQNNFTLTGNALIEQGQNKLKGSKRIQFTSKTNVMVLEGTAQNPAQFDYILSSGNPWHSEAEIFHLVFKDTGGNRKLHSVKTIKGHQGSRLMPKNKRLQKNMMRKTGSPQ